MSESDEDRVAKALSEQRRLDEGFAPDFRALLARPRARSSRAPARPVLILAALLLAIGIVLRVRSRPPVSAPHKPASVAADSLTTWRAPTDFLLETPGSQLWTSPPVFGSAAAKEALSQPEGEKGKKS
jgi:hypothetical protein